MKALGNAFISLERKQQAMALIGIFRRKEKEAKEPNKETATATPAEKTALEALCGDDKELLGALTRTILLTPEMTVKEGIDSYLEKAQRYEKEGNSLRARTAYQVAGEIALYEGNLEMVQRCFQKAAEVDPSYPFKYVFDYFAETKNAERAMSVAHQFYTEKGKLKEMKEDSSGWKHSLHVFI